METNKNICCFHTKISRASQGYIENPCPKKLIRTIKNQACYREKRATLSSSNESLMEATIVYHNIGMWNVHTRVCGFLNKIQVFGQKNRLLFNVASFEAFIRATISSLEPNEVAQLIKFLANTTMCFPALSVNRLKNSTNFTTDYSCVLEVIDVAYSSFIPKNSA